MNPAEILGQASSRKIMVLGDLMLDHYLWGKVQRISPEAPVPILEATSEEFRMGGAANAALNLRAMGAQVILIGVVGKDEAGEKLLDGIKAAGIDPSGLLTANDRPSTIKSRILAGNQQIVRIDRESSAPIDNALRESILDLIRTELPGCDALIVEDYDKGLLDKDLIDRLRPLCQQAEIPIAVDPKDRNFFHYRDVDIFKPNFRELQRNTGFSCRDEAELLAQAQEFRSCQGIRHLVLTRSAKGMYVFSEDGVSHLPSVAREVFDVSGAGDTVISALTLAWVCGAGILDATRIANHAAGVACGKMGTATVNAEEILRSMREQG